MATVAKVWFSESSNYDNFDEGVNDSDSFSLGVPTTNEFRWIEGVDSLMVGTSGDEWRISSPKEGGNLTPTSFEVIMQSGFGSNTVQPKVVNAVILFVDAVGRRVHELVWNDLNQKFLAPDLSVLAEHITSTGITCMAVQKYPDMIVWCTLADGSLISLTYNREQNIVAWSDHPITGALAKSVCVTPNATTGEDEVTVTCERTINSSTVAYIEKLNVRTLPALLADCYFLDCGITYSGVATNTITVSHLIGQTVNVLGSGGTSGTGTIYRGLVVASDGLITLPTVLTVAQTVTKAQVGIAYSTELQPMRLDISTQNGTGLGSTKIIPEMVVSLLDSAGVKYGDSLTDLHDLDITSTGVINKSAITGLFSGDATAHLTGGFSVDDSIIIASSDPLPLTVRCMIPKVDVSGR